MQSKNELRGDPGYYNSLQQWRIHFVTAAKALGWTPSYDSKRERDSLLLRVFDVHGDAKAKRACSQIRADLQRGARNAKRKAEDRNESADQRLAAQPISVQARKTITRLRKRRLNEKINDIKTKARKEAEAKIASYNEARQERRKARQALPLSLLFAESRQLMQVEELCKSRIQESGYTSRPL